MQFEWDPAKAADNASKHGVEFAEAMTILAIRLKSRFGIPAIPWGSAGF